MDLKSFSVFLEQITHPQHPGYHPFQVILLGSMSYVGTAYLTSIPPKRGMTFIVAAYVISQLITPFFCNFFEPYRDVSLVPLIGQVLQLSTSLILSKIICRIVGQSLSFKDIRKITLIMVVTIFVSRFALLKFRQQVLKN